MWKRAKPARSVLVALSILGCILAAPPAQAGKARNVIIFISDGGGFNAYNAATYYEFGRLGAEIYDGPEWVKLACAHWSMSTIDGRKQSDAPVGRDLPYNPDETWNREAVLEGRADLSATPKLKAYELLMKVPTDSAAAGTALASGLKTRNGAINCIPGKGPSGRFIALTGRTIAELAKASGRSTGVITSVDWSDATPATLGGAHATARGNRYSIANEMLNSPTLDVIMGAGHPEYDRDGLPRQPQKESEYALVGGSFTWRLLKSGRHAGGWKLIETKAQFEALTRGRAPARVLGVPRVAGALQQERRTRDWNHDGLIESQDSRLAPPYGDPYITTVPSLVTMARGALNVLSRNPKGFYLMIEGGAVDRAEHANQLARTIEEQIDFNHTIRAVAQWIEANSSWDETLVIITSDHETGLIWGPNSDAIAFDTPVNRGAGRAPGVLFNSGGHSHSLVPLRARGPGAELFVPRAVGGDPVFGMFVDNTSVFQVMRSAMGIREQAEPPRIPADEGNSPEKRSTRGRKNAVLTKVEQEAEGD